MKFEWKDEYAVGDTTVDNEHKRLFELANVIINSATNDELINNAMHLYRHIREHFHNEEKLMQVHAYPDYERHVDDHNQMLASLISKSDVIREGNWNKTQAVEFMTRWVSHITSGDRQFKNYLVNLKSQ